MAETVTFRTARMETGQLIIDIPHDQRGSVMHWLKTRKDRDYDQTTERNRLREYFREYLMDHYPGWDEINLYYQKGCEYAN